MECKLVYPGCRPATSGFQMFVRVFWDLSKHKGDFLNSAWTFCSIMEESELEDSPGWEGSPPTSVVFWATQELWPHQMTMYVKDDAL